MFNYLPVYIIYDSYLDTVTDMKENKKMLINGTDYKLIFLDSNAIREITNNTFSSGKGFLENYLAKDIPYIPCFSIYNVIELKPNIEGFQKFIDYFNIVPCLMFYFSRTIIQEEVNYYLNNEPFMITNKIMYSFSLLNKQGNYSFSFIINEILTKMERLIDDEIKRLSSIASEWEEQRINKGTEKVSQTDIMNLYRYDEEKIIRKDLNSWGKRLGEFDINQLPALRIMSYSQFCRVHLTQKPIKPNDVMDITISSIIPYVDAVITEGFQADIYKKSKLFITQMKDVKILTLKDIRGI